MQTFYDAFGAVLAFFYDLVPNYAFAIVMLTLVVMLIVTPLTLKGTRSMMVMQQLQPEMKKIQQKYKDDRQRLNEELLKFYKEHEINPLGGCLPLLVQMPIFLVLYQVLRGLTRRVSGLGFDVGWATGQAGTARPPSSPPSIVRTFDPAYVNQGTSLYHNLSSSTQMNALGLDLSESASSALGQSFWHALPYLVLIAIVGVTGFVQQRQIQGRNTGAQVNPQQQAIMRIMPIFLPVISFTLPAGLVLYFAVSNLFRIGQQAFISRSIYGMSRAEMKENRAKTKVSAKATKADNGKGGGKPAKADRPAKAVPSKKDGRDTSKAAGGAAANKSTGARAQKSPRTTPKPSRGGSGQTQNPTLQPRARKNKKR
jgi:YidC/Oxa1 family membrane protein insertase